MSDYNLESTDYNIIYPHNLKKYKNLEVLSKIIEQELKENVISKLSKLAIIKNLELQNDEILNELANQLQIENWNDNYELQIKVRLIRTAYWAHSKKGTRPVIEAELKKLGYTLKLEEWWEYNGKPYTFRIVTNDIVKTEDWITRIVKSINKVKNVRSHLDVVKNKHTLVKIYNIVGYKELRMLKETQKISDNISLEKNIYIKAYKQLIKEDL